MRDGDYFPVEAAYELASRAAGIGAGAVMELAPGVVMPTRVIAVAIRRLLEEEYGLAAPEGYR